ncbi:hypothetical protein GCM10010284_03850 [Streptomyces rubiginosohelvolus]|uniref:Regulatory protein n=2 Tax=Streptomyces rubiginosohelvolus TaxID=67362 RepID=A0ABQ3BF07_9ACTN|nr:hypothetical protein GCM10010284_03850 [Streptomyces rubiginosohelvolus]GGZ38434.1 hypothetical protein GCM10010328_10290 [Streptomyces pluricolorescens]
MRAAQPRVLLRLRRHDLDLDMPQLAQLKQMFELSLLRIEVSDARGERLPVVGQPSPTAEGGRGVLLVEALSVRWGTEHGPFARKTVRAEVALTGS